MSSTTSPKSILDAGGLTARLAARQALNRPGDQGQFIAEFLDADGVVLGTIATPCSMSAPAAGSRSAPGAVPPGGARQVRIRLRVVLVERSVPNVAFDDLSLVIEEDEDATSGSGGQNAVLVVVLM